MGWREIGVHTHGTKCSSTEQAVREAATMSPPPPS